MSKLNASTITDEQILALRNDAYKANDIETVRLCHSALTHEYMTGSLDPMFTTWTRNEKQHADRGHCADILNMRANLPTEGK